MRVACLSGVVVTVSVSALASAQVIIERVAIDDVELLANGGPTFTTDGTTGLRVSSGSPAPAGQRAAGLSFSLADLPQGQVVAAELVFDVAATSRSTTIDGVTSIPEVQVGAAAGGGTPEFDAALGVFPVNFEPFTVTNVGVRSVPLPLDTPLAGSGDSATFGTLLSTLQTLANDQGDAFLDLALFNSVSSPLNLEVLIASTEANPDIFSPPTLRLTLVPEPGSAALAGLAGLALLRRRR